MDRTASAGSRASSRRPGVPAPDPERADNCAATVLEAVPAVMDALRSAMRRHVGEQLSVPQFRCLNFVAREPGTSVGAVASFLGVTMPTASAMVDRLVRAGAIRMSESPDDRRRVQLRLTPAGRAQLKGIRDGAHRDLTQILAALSASELRRLQDGLVLLQRAFPQR
jgi:DNA-binding MarR family transcriptional regulator